MPTFHQIPPLTHRFHFQSHHPLFLLFLFSRSILRYKYANICMWMVMDEYFFWVCGRGVVTVYRLVGQAALQEEGQRTEHKQPHQTTASQWRSTRWPSSWRRTWVPPCSIFKAKAYALCPSPSPLPSPPLPATPGTPWWLLPPSPPPTSTTAATLTHSYLIPTPMAPPPPACPSWPCSQPPWGTAWPTRP